ncbi:hypothetical protein GCM10009556_016240 [Acrocarpospora pleiomorpha]|uniref:hypothetical protein n=1 Tax=Acrocarpospora pleiomorpha TaxID=90975 RepID=UPI0012D2A15F|nr:hypothetical protein [Acrocarpospora pleiomorpha]
MTRQLRNSARAAIRRYLRENGAGLLNTLYSEQPIRVHVTPGVTVDGRIDLIKRLDDSAASQREVINERLLLDIRDKILDAGDALRENRLPRKSQWCDTCARCDLVGLCRDNPTVAP